jgi:hypothetical protein
VASGVRHCSHYRQVIAWPEGGRDLAFLWGALRPLAPYIERGTQLAAALAHQDEEQREAARSALRGFVAAIVIPPGDGLLEVRGDLERMLAAAAGERDGSVLAAVAYDGCGGGIVGWATCVREAAA